jgi:hypothetical protein
VKTMGCAANSVCNAKVLAVQHITCNCWASMGVTYLLGLVSLQLCVWCRECFHSSWSLLICASVYLPGTAKCRTVYVPGTNRKKAQYAPDNSTIKHGPFSTAARR